MKKFRTAIVQYDTPTPDIEYNSQLAERLILEAETNGADISKNPQKASGRNPQKASARNK